MPLKNTSTGEAVRFRDEDLPTTGTVNRLFSEDSIVTISQLKTAVLSVAGITTEWVRSEFGDLRLKSTWQAAYDRCSEFVAVVVDRAATAAQYFAAVLVPCLWAVLWLGCLCYHTGEALAGWWHSAPSKATDSTAVVLSRFQDARLSSTVSILA